MVDLPLAGGATPRHSAIFEVRLRVEWLLRNESESVFLPRIHLAMIQLLPVRSGTYCTMNLEVALLMECCQPGRLREVTLLLLAFWGQLQLQAAGLAGIPLP